MSVTIDSTNPRIIADNIRKLDGAVQAVASELPEVETTDEGKVLTVNASGEWAALDLPPYPVGNLDYSETEQNIGVKWIDGKDIYRKAISATLPEITQTGYVAVIALGEVNFLYGVFTVYNTPVLNSIPLLYSSSGNGAVTLTSSSSEKDYIAIAYYTKPAPTREPDDAPDAEPELKKVTKKKTTKKEEE